MARLSVVARSEHVIVPLAYLLVAVVASFPLITQMGTHIAGVQGDVWSYLWAAGWARVAVLNLGVNPFHTDYVYYPLGGATQLLWGTALPSFASIPLQLAFGLVPAFNLTYLGSSVLTGWGTYLLFREQFSHVEFRGVPGKNYRRNMKLAGFLAGLAFAFSALRLGYGLAFTNLFHTEFIPFYALYLLRTTRSPGWKNAVMAGLFFGLNAYIDFQIAAFLGLLTALWFLYVLARAILRGRKSPAEPRRKRVPDRSGLLARYLVMVIVAGAIVLPMLVILVNDFAVEGGNYIRVFPLRYSTERSYDLLSYVLPNARSTLYQNVTTPRVENVNASVQTPDESELSPDRQSFLGVVLGALALVGAIRLGRQMVFWIFVTLVFAALSLGPVLHFAGVSTNLPLPFALVNNIPILNNIRIPMRYGLMVFFGASLLAGAGAFVVLQWRAWMLVPIAALLLAETLVLPYPTLEFRVPRVYEKIAQTPGDATVLEIPSFNWRYAAQNEAYQAIHQKRILRAYTNRIAPDLADYFSLRRTPIVVRSLRILEGAEQGILTKDEIAEDRSVLDDTLAFFNLRYAVLHRDQLPADRVTQIDEYMRNVLHARVMDDDGTVIAYELPQTDFTAKSGAPELASDTTLMYLGRGWQTEPLAEEDGSRGRYANAARGEVYLPQSSTFRLNLEMYSAQADALLNAQLNGADLPAFALRKGWGTYTVPASLTEPLNVFHLIFSSDLAKQFALSAFELK